MQNGFGATFTYGAAKWKKGDCYVAAEEKLSIYDHPTSTRMVMISVMNITLYSGKAWLDCLRQSPASAWLHTASP